MALTDNFAALRLKCPQGWVTAECVDSSAWHRCCRCRHRNFCRLWTRDTLRGHGGEGVALEAAPVARCQAGSDTVPAGKLHERCEADPVGQDCHTRRYFAGFLHSLHSSDSCPPASALRRRVAGAACDLVLDSGAQCQEEPPGHEFFFEPTAPRPGRISGRLRSLALSTGHMPLEGKLRWYLGLIGKRRRKKASGSAQQPTSRQQSGGDEQRRTSGAVDFSGRLKSIRSWRVARHEEKRSCGPDGGSQDRPAAGASDGPSPLQGEVLRTAWQRNAGEAEAEASPASFHEMDCAKGDIVQVWAEAEAGWSRSEDESWPAPGPTSVEGDCTYSQCSPRTVDVAVCPCAGGPFSGNVEDGSGRSGRLTLRGILARRSSAGAGTKAVAGAGPLSSAGTSTRRSDSSTSSDGASEDRKESGSEKVLPGAGAFHGYGFFKVEEPFGVRPSSRQEEAEGPRNSGGESGSLLQVTDDAERPSEDYTVTGASRPREGSPPAAGEPVPLILRQRWLLYRVCAKDPIPVGCVLKQFISFGPQRADCLCALAVGGTYLLAGSGLSTTTSRRLSRIYYVLWFLERFRHCSRH